MTFVPNPDMTKDALQPHLSIFLLRSEAKNIMAGLKAMQKQHPDSREILRRAELKIRTAYLLAGEARALLCSDGSTPDFDDSQEKLRRKSVLMELREDYESQMGEEFDRELSTLIDCVTHLLESGRY